MSDRALRQTETAYTRNECSQAKRLVERYRARVTMAVLVRESAVTCGGISHKEQRLFTDDQCSLCPGTGIEQPCHTVTREPGTAQAVTSVLAYAGLDVARGLAWAPCDPPVHQGPWFPSKNNTSRSCFQHAGGWGLPDWLQGAQCLCESLPDLTVEGVACECGGSGWHRPSDPLGECVSCKGTGKRDVTVKAADYAMVWCAWAAAKAALDLPMDVYAERSGSSTRAWSTIRKALDAVERWLACPCPTREAEWREAQGDMPTGLPGFVPRVHDLVVARERDAAHQNLPTRIQAADKLTQTARADCSGALLAMCGWDVTRD